MSFTRTTMIATGLMALASGVVTTAKADEQVPDKQTATSAASPLVIEGVINAPVEEVWKVFSTAEGFKKFGVAQCDLDLKVGGLIRTHYNPNGVLGDDDTIVNEILAYEPERMMAFRIKQPPAAFPFSRETWSKTWSVATLTDLGDNRTHVRLTGLGYTDAAESQAMRNFFQAGNTWTIQMLQRQFDASAPGPQGGAHNEDPLAPIAHEQVVDFPRTEAWRMFTTEGGWKQFLGVDGKIELRPGGAFELLFDKNGAAGKQGSEGCTVLSFIPEKMLSFTWNAPPQFAHARGERTWVVAHFDALTPTRTRVRLEHLGFTQQVEVHPDQREEWENVRAYFQKAWGRVLEELANGSTPPTRGTAGSSETGPEMETEASRES